MIRCGEKGFLTKTGKPCGYFIHENDACCPHHDEDKTRARQFQTKGWAQAQDNKLPVSIDTNEFQSTGDIKCTLAQVVKEATTNKRADLKRLGVVIQACNAAGTIMNTEAVKELNDTIARAEGHGPALVILEGLKQGRTRALPSPKRVGKETVHG